MKRYILVLVSSVFIFLLSENVLAQNVCIGINGTTPTVLPNSAKTVKLCRLNGATTVNLYQKTLTMTSCGTIPASNVFYQWKNITTGYIPLSGSTVLTSETGKWVATVKNTISLIEYTDTLNLVYHDSIGINIISNELLFPNEWHCPLTVLTLTATLYNLPLTSKVKWLSLTPMDTLKGTTPLTLNFRPKNTLYTGFVKDANGCAASDTSIYFALDSNFKANLGPDHLLKCEGDKDTLKTLIYSGLRSLSYDTHYGYVDAFGNVTNLGVTTTNTVIFPPVVVDSMWLRDKFEPIPIVLAPGVNKYWVRLSSGLACQGADTIIIKANPKPVVEIGNDTLLCYDFSLNIKAKILVGTAPYHYTWSTTSTDNSITVSPTVATNYSVSVTDKIGCGAGTDSKLVEVNPKIDVTVSNDATICRYPPGTANLVATASGGTGTLTYEWIPNDGLSSATILTPTAVPVEPAILPSTVYNFFATDDNNCSNPFGAGQPNKVTVFYFKPSLASIPDPIIISESSPQDLNVSTAANGGYSFSWTTTVSSSELNSSPILSLSYNGPDTTYYIITAHSNSDGVLNSCINADTIEVRYISDNTLLYVPNVFSPNAMNPENQKLRIYGDNLFGDGFKFLIFNRWGNIMYESTDLNEVKTNGWDGGSQVEGVYTYLIVGKFKNGKDVKESAYNKGSFTLVK